MIKQRYFDDARDKNVANYVVYGKSADHKLYYDLTVTTPVQVTQADVEDAFAKGRLIIVTDDGMFAAINVVENVVLTAAMAGTLGSEVITGVEWAAEAIPVG